MSKMTPIDRAISDVMAAMVVDHDVANTLSQLVLACCASYPADSVAILASAGAGDLELLSSSSHEAEEIELLQIQNHSGPCADVIDSDKPIIVAGAAALINRWADVGRAIVTAGYDEAHAYPMRWRGRTVGGLNIFLRTGTATDSSVGQLFADLATVAVLQAHDLSGDQILARVYEAVTSRAIIEQAKGVLAHQESLDMNQAHLRLAAMAHDLGAGISTVAVEIVQNAHTGPALP